MRKFFWKASVVFVFLLIGSWFLFNNLNNSVQAAGGTACYFTASFSLNITDEDNWLREDDETPCGSLSDKNLIFGNVASNTGATTTAEAYISNGDFSAVLLIMQPDYTGSITFSTTGTVSLSQYLQIDGGTFNLTAGN